MWNCGNGRFLYWFHNHGGRFIGELGAGGKGGRSTYDDRNPAWLMAGREIKTAQGVMIEWSQPEILLYDDDSFIRMSQRPPAKPVACKRWNRSKRINTGAGQTGSGPRNISS